MTPPPGGPANVPSCATCPSRLEPAEVASFFGKSVGVPVCARFGKPIGRLNSSPIETDKISKHFAKNCGKYGEPRPGAPDWSKASFRVMLPDPEVLGKPKNRPELVSACGMCANFVREDIVASEVGYSSGLCSAKGKLLMSTRLTLEARNCEDRTFGNVRLDTNGLTFLPEYDDNFAGNQDPTRQYFANKGNFVDPVDYPTDREVTDEESEQGIRAWREVSDPETGNSTYLPIFNVEYFDAEEQKKIPRTGDDEHPEDYVDHRFLVYKVAVLWQELDETPAFWGEAGTGKTEFFRHMAWLMCLPFERFSITGSTELDDIAGKVMYEPAKGTFFHEGRITKAWGKPCVLVVDEPTAGQPDVWQFLRPMTDNSKELVLDMLAGDKYPRNDNCFLGMAMNPVWDMRNVGLQQISDPDANRLMHIFIELPDEKLEKEIIKTKVSHDGWEIPDETLTFVMDVSKEIRALCSEGTLDITWAIRPQLKVARALRWFDPITAYRMASADYLEPVKQETLLDVVRAHISSS